MLRSRALILLIFLLLGPALSSCYAFIPTPTPVPTVVPTFVPPTPTPEPTVDPRLGGRLTVRLSHNLDRLTPLLPATDIEAGWVLGMLYAGLTRLDDRLQPQPDLAERWDVSSNGLVITFTLRPNLRWSDGTPLTADDVLFTYGTLRMWDVRTGAQANLRDYVAGVTAPTSRTVALVLNRRLAGILADVSFPILPRHIWGHLGPAAVQDVDLLPNPVGSGPFILRERRQGEALLLTPNPYYHGAPPFLDEVAFLVAPEDNVAELALRQGDLHVALLPRACCDSLEQSPPRNPVRVGRYPASQYTFVAFNLHEGFPMADVRLRQAWALALDKEALVAEATGGEGIPLWSPILRPGYALDETLSSVGPDLTAARALVAEAGWEDNDGDGIVEKDGEPLQVRLFVRADAPERITATLHISETLGQIGIAVQVIPADFQSVIAAKLRPPYDFDALCMQWRNLGPDPDQFYLFHSSQAWQGLGDTRANLYNFVGYRRAEADQLLLTGRSTYDPVQRREIYVELQRLLAQDLPYYLLWGDPIYIAANGHLTTDEGPINLETPQLFWNVEEWYWGE